MKSHLRQLDIIVCGASADIIYMCVRHAHAGVTRKRHTCHVVAQVPYLHAILTSNRAITCPPTLQHINEFELCLDGMILK